MITHQHPLTIIAPVEPGKLNQLHDLLISIQQPDIESNNLVPFSKIKSVHFARFVILECDTDLFPIQLAFSSDFDGDESSHIAELVREAKEGLIKIYYCCTGFHGNLEKYWAAHRIPTKAFYNGHQGVSAQQIRQDNALRDTIAGYLDQSYIAGDLQHLSAVQIKQLVAAFIKQNNDFEWAVRNEGLHSFGKFIFERKALLSALLKGVLVVLIIGYLVVQICKLLKIHAYVGFLSLFAFLGIGLFYCKRKLNQLENSDLTDEETPTAQHVNALMHAENFQVQNQLTHLVEIKPGRFRLRLLKFVLRTINFLAKTLFNKGKLGGIPSIHFARWLIIDKGRRLLFFSNFDGSWESYLGDFVDKATTGLTGVWSNTKNFPKSYNLVQEGARDEQHFKEWARHLQISTQVWYSAYKKLSVQNINNNASIRSGLFQTMNEKQAQVWLDQVFYNKG